MNEEREPFLARWSKRKAGVREGGAVDDAAPAVANGTAASLASHAPADVAPVDVAIEPTAPPPERERVEPPTMNDVASLDATSDFSRFVGTGVDRGVSNAAMKKLFADPRFNVMDGLDTYIDDYGKPDPIPPSMLRRMVQSQALGLFADDPVDEAEAEGAAPVPLPESPTPPLPAALASNDDDADLRLQPDDAARRPGARAGARP